MLPYTVISSASNTYTKKSKRLGVLILPPGWLIVVIFIYSSILSSVSMINIAEQRVRDAAMRRPLGLFEVLTRNRQSAVELFGRSICSQEQPNRVFTIPPRQRLSSSTRLAIRRWRVIRLVRRLVRIIAEYFASHLGSQFLMTCLQSAHSSSLLTRAIHTQSTYKHTKTKMFASTLNSSRALSSFSTSSSSSSSLKRSSNNSKIRFQSPKMIKAMGVVDDVMQAIEQNKKDVSRRERMKYASPPGVPQPPIVPIIEPGKFGFVDNAETMNSRASMIGWWSLLLVELVAGKGLLELLGLPSGKGLTLLFNCNDNKNNFTRHEIIISVIIIVIQRS